MQSKPQKYIPLRKIKEKKFLTEVWLTETQYVKLLGVLCDAVEGHEFDSDFRTILREVIKG